MKSYDVFLFDADDTLFDFDKAEINALKIMFEHYGFEYTEDALLKYRKINESLWKSYGNGDITIADLQSKRFSRLFTDIESNFNSIEFNEKYLIELGKGAFLIDGAFEICKYIISCNKNIYIITNGLLATQKSRLKYSLIKDYISGFFVSEEIGFAKPDIKYFEHVFSQLSSFDKSKMLIIGDNLSTDILGANNAGIDSCWFNPLGKANDKNIIPTYEIQTLKELHAFIN